MNEAIRESQSSNYPVDNSWSLPVILKRNGDHEVSIFFPARVIWVFSHFIISIHGGYYDPRAFAVYERISTVLRSFSNFTRQYVLPNESYKKQYAYTNTNYGSSQVSVIKTFFRYVFWLFVLGIDGLLAYFIFKTDSIIRAIGFLALTLLVWTWAIYLCDAWELV